MKKMLVSVALAAVLAVPSFGADGQVAANANNEFGLELFKNTQKTTAKGNKFLSPASAYLALAMLYNGATGETADQIAEALALTGLTLEEINESSQALMTALTETSEFELNIANSVWARQGYKIKSDFKRNVNKHFDASVDTLDFDADDASKIINAWVMHQTKGKIDSIVPDKLPENLVMFLANAIYFDAKWALPFDPNDTRERPFNGRNGVEKVAMMSNTGNFKYASLRNGEGIELPYGQKNEASMILFKPSQDLDTFVSGLDAASWASTVSAIRGAQSTYGSVTIPSLELEYEDTLNGTLQAMGMKRAFANNAQLGELVELKAGKNVKVTSVLQKTFLKVYEEGTIAAAVTGISVGITSLPPQPKFNFVADSPYVLAIRDNRTGAILFFGAIAMPEGGKLPN